QPFEMAICPRRDSAPADCGRGARRAGCEGLTHDDFDARTGLVSRKRKGWPARARKSGAAGPANVLLGDVHRLPERLDRMIGVAARNLEELLVGCLLRRYAEPLGGLVPLGSRF